MKHGTRLPVDPPPACWSAEAALSAPYGLADLSVMIAPVLGQVAYVRTDLSRPLRLSYLNRLRVKMH